MSIASNSKTFCFLRWKDAKTLQREVKAMSLSGGEEKDDRALKSGVTFAPTGHFILLRLAAISALQNEISYRFSPALLAWLSGYLSSGLIPEFLKGFKRNCY